MRKLAVGVVIFLSMLVLCSCSGLNKTPDENQILSDYLVKSIEPEYANFSAVEIKRSQLNKENKTFIADIEVIGKDDYADYICSSSILYNYYDDQGWMLDEIKSREFKTACHTGRSAEDIENDIRTNFTSYIPHGVWVDNIKVEDIFEQNMQLVTFDCETTENYLTATYNVYMYFKYENGAWCTADIVKNPSNFKINLEGTLWVEKQPESYIDRGDWYIKIKKVSEDSKTIVFEYEGANYTGTLISNYTEIGFEHGAEYKLDKPMDRGTRSWTVFEEKMYMTHLMVFSTSTSPRIAYDIVFESELRDNESPSYVVQKNFTMVK